MQKQSIKPAFSANIWGAWISVACIWLLLFLIWLPIKNLIPTQDPVISVLLIILLLCVIAFLVIPITTVLHFKEPTMLRQAAANTNDIKTVALDIPVRLFPPNLPVQVQMTVSNLYLPARLLTLIFMVVIFLGIGILALRIDYGITFGLLTLNCFIVSIFMYSLNNMQLAYTASSEGLEVHKRWTRAFIRWQDVRLFWSLGAKAIDPQELSMPSRFAQYDIATKDQRILLVIQGKRIVAKYADDPQTYYARMSDILYTIAYQSGVTLREPRFEQKTEVKRPTKK